MANLTLTVHEGLLKRARIRALEQGTSVNAVVRDFLQQYAGDDPAVAALSDFLDAAKRAQSGSGSGGRVWTRDDLYQDRSGRLGE